MRADANSMRADANSMRADANSMGFWEGIMEKVKPSVIEGLHWKEKIGR